MADEERAPVNTDHEALKGFVERMTTLERDFEEVKAEYTDSKKDLKGEIKSREDETGVTVKQVLDLTKIRLKEQAAIEEQEELEANMELYRLVFGFTAAPPAPAEEDDDDALG